RFPRRAAPADWSCLFPPSNSCEDHGGVDSAEPEAITHGYPWTGYGRIAADQAHISPQGRLEVQIGVQEVVPDLEQHGDRLHYAGCPKCMPEQALRGLDLQGRRVIAKHVHDGL